MPITIVVGLQWGDEGKGKIVDYLVKDYEVLIRFQGGANAGHTVIRNEKQIVFHLIPTGIVNKGKIGILGPGVILDPDSFLEEVSELEKFAEEPIWGRVLIDFRVNLVLPYHKACDRWEEELKKGVGSTRMGIGPTYRDLYGRFGIRIGDLFDESWLRERLKISLEFNNQILGARYGKPPLIFQDIYEKLLTFKEKISPYIIDTRNYLQPLLRDNKKILIEGAQGALLDIFYGTYPYVTSSHTITGGAISSLALDFKCIDKIIGVSKIYTTRVGKGPFPTEIKDEQANLIRERGKEYGATTGRPRRVGWLDLVLLKYAVSITNPTEIAITKVDVLQNLPKIKVAVKYNNSIFILNTLSLSKIEPIYQEFNGWEKFGEVERYEDLPKNLRSLIEFIEEQVGVPVKLISYGRDAREIVEKL